MASAKVQILLLIPGMSSSSRTKWIFMFIHQFSKLQNQEQQLYFLKQLNEPKLTNGHKLVSFFNGSTVAIPVPTGAAICHHSSQTMKLV